MSKRRLLGAISMELPKNISQIQYKNLDGTKVVKFRVRVSIKKIKFDELFDDLKEAKEYLATIKSKKGREVLTEEEEAENKRLEEFSKPKFDWYFNTLYFHYKHPRPTSIPSNKDDPKQVREAKDFYNSLEGIEKQNEILRRKQYQTYLSFFRTLTTTKFLVARNSKGSEQGIEMISRVNPQSISDEVSFGELRLSQITNKTINGYIRKRKEQGKSVITVRKELSVLNCFFAEIHNHPLYSDDPIDNPCRYLDKSLLKEKKELKGHKAKRIDNDNIEKLKTCIQLEPVEFGYTCLLQYYGAFRMSEAIGLLWENINLKTKRILLPQTKTNPRRVSITKPLEDLLNVIEPDPSKRTGLVVKNQTLYKYQKQIQKFRLKYGFEINTHQFRKDAVSRLIQNVGKENKVKLASILGYTNVKQFEQDYIQDEPDVNTLDGIMSHIGHAPSSINILANIYNELEDFNDGEDSKK